MVNEHHPKRRRIGFNVGMTPIWHMRWHCSSQHQLLDIFWSLGLLEQVFFWQKPWLLSAPWDFVRNGAWQHKQHLILCLLWIQWQLSIIQWSFNQESRVSMVAEHHPSRLCLGFRGSWSFDFVYASFNNMTSTLQSWLFASCSNPPQVHQLFMHGLWNWRWCRAHTNHSLW